MQLQLKLLQRNCYSALAHLKAQYDLEAICLMKESSDACTEAPAAIKADTQAQPAQQHPGHEEAKKAATSAI